MCERVLADPYLSEPQTNGRIRFWARAPMKYDGYE